MGRTSLIRHDKYYSNCFSDVSSKDELSNQIQFSLGRVRSFSHYRWIMARHLRRDENEGANTQCISDPKPVSYHGNLQSAIFSTHVHRIALAYCLSSIRSDEHSKEIS